MLVTLSEDGMFLHVEGAEPVHIPAYPVKVRDVSGAGDTVVATLAALLAIGADFESGGARRQRGGVGRRRQARHRRGDARRIARARVAVRGVRVGRKDRVRLDGRRRAGARVARAGAARRLYQRLLRSPASRATSRCWRRRAAPATGWWSVSTATPRSRD